MKLLQKFVVTAVRDSLQIARRRFPSHTRKVWVAWYLWALSVTELPGLDWCRGKVAKLENLGKITSNPLAISLAVSVCLKMSLNTEVSSCGVAHVCASKFLSLSDNCGCIWAAYPWPWAKGCFNCPIFPGSCSGTGLVGMDQFHTRKLSSSLLVYPLSLWDCSMH